MAQPLSVVNISIYGDFVDPKRADTDIEYTDPVEDKVDELTDAIEDFAKLKAEELGLRVTF